MTDKIILDGREVKVGDMMWSAVTGYGAVTSVRLTDDYPICLRSDRLGSNNYFSSNGAFYKGGPRCLFWSEPKFDPPPPPKRKVKKWQWLYKCYGNREWAITPYFPSEDEARNYVRLVNGVIGPFIIPTEIEVEE